MKQRWIDSVSNALQRVAARRGTQTIRRSQLIAEELATIVSETGSRGRTPEQTLNRTLQSLRNKGVIRFSARGVYELTAALFPQGRSPIRESLAATSAIGRPVVPGETFS